MKKGLLFTTVLFTTITTITAQKATLNLSKGQKMQIVTTSQVKTSAEVMGQTMENNVDTDVTESAEVTKADKNLEITVTTTKMKTNVTAMGQEMAYDSEKKDNDERAEEMFAKKLNKAIIYTIATDGTIVKEDKSAIKDDEEGGNPMQMMSGGGGNSGPSFYNAAFLNKEFTNGAMWKDSTEQKGKMNSKVVNNYKVIGIENGIVTIENNAIQTLTGTIEQMGQEMSMTGNNTIKATYKVNVKTGLLVESTSTVGLNMNIEAMGMTIPSTGSVVTKSVITAL